MSEQRAAPEILKALRDYDIRPHIKQKQQTNRGTMVDYIPWFRLCDILDSEVVWSKENTEHATVAGKFGVKCRITIQTADGPLVREAWGYEEEEEDYTDQNGVVRKRQIFGDVFSNAEASALRRCAAMFGLGRSLWDKDRRQAEVARPQADTHRSGPAAPQNLHTSQGASRQPASPPAPRKPYDERPAAQPRSIEPAQAVRSDASTLFTALTDAKQKEMVEMIGGKAAKLDIKGAVLKLIISGLYSEGQAKGDSLPEWLAGLTVGQCRKLWKDELDKSVKAA